MSEQSFSLIPFPASHIPAISLTGELSLENTTLTLHYSLDGDLEEISLPPASSIPSRKDELWKSTCFEFFLAIKDQPDYWEFNMSPSGDWNVYRMDAYRRIGFREERAITQLPIEYKKEPERFVLNVSVDLSPLIHLRPELQMAITAIIQTKDGKETYWALAHPGTQPDFHRRESFILRLEGQMHPSEQSARAG
ncbi:MAG TPA: DOMON-like domain-containing protein [Anaerolineales bacterium]|nr:DOMON-like domain-containing protein [Anaerolineales bacterium]